MESLIELLFPIFDQILALVGTLVPYSVWDVQQELRWSCLNMGMDRVNLCSDAAV